jgi:nitrite reductase/ring-hydroxylating ferredoxin subunit
MMKAVRSLARRLGVSAQSSDRYVRACAYGEIAAGEIRRVDGLPVVLCHAAGELYALAMSCPHAGAQLVKGRLVDGCLECPLHGARFAVEDGAVRRGPARRRLPSHDVKVCDGIVYVSRLPRRPLRRGRPAQPAFRRRGRR